MNIIAKTLFNTFFNECFPQACHFDGGKDGTAVQTFEGYSCFLVLKVVGKGYQKKDKKPIN